MNIGGGIIIEKISVIVPVFNTEKYLERCILSITNQTYSNLEIILINDGSTDRSLEICNTYAINDNRITVIDKSNEGVSRARNTGLELSKGEYIAFVDSDDWIESDMFENMMKTIENTESEVCICNYYQDSQKKFLNINKKLLNTDEIVENLIKNMIGPLPVGSKNVNKSIMGTSCRYLIKRSMLEENNIKFSNEISLSEDLIFCIQFLFSTSSLSINPGAYYHYESISNSATRKFKPNFRQQNLLVYEKIKNICYENYGRHIEQNLDSMHIEMSISEIVNQVHADNPVNIINKIKNIKDICTSSKFINILNKVTTGDLEISRHILFTLVRLKQYWLIYFLYKFLLEINQPK